MRMMRVDRELAERHYAEHAEKPFFGELVGFITSGDVVVARITLRDGDVGAAAAAPVGDSRRNDP